MNRTILLSIKQTETSDKVQPSLLCCFHLVLYLGSSSGNILGQGALLL